METNAMEKLSYGLFVLTVRNEDKDNGCIINTVMQTANAPTRICLSVNKANFTHDLLIENRHFTVSVISTEADFELFRRFGFSSGRDTDKFKDYPHVKRTANETLAITQGANAFLSGTVTETVDLGSHTLFIAEVSIMGVLSDAPSATYDYYHREIKPKPAAKAEKSEKTVWRCKICGYEYEGEELPADYICPLCKHPASDFEKI